MLLLAEIPGRPAARGASAGRLAARGGSRDSAAVYYARASSWKVLASIGMIAALIALASGLAVFPALIVGIFALIAAVVLLRVFWVLLILR